MSHLSRRSARPSTSLRVALALAAGLAFGSTQSIAAEGDAKASADASEAMTPSRVAAGHSFGTAQGRQIRTWFALPANLASLPPGITNRETLPHGSIHRVDRNKPLPADLKARLQPLPAALEAELPKIAEGHRRVILGNDVLLMDDAAGRVRDILHAVLPE